MFREVGKTSFFVLCVFNRVVGDLEREHFFCEEFQKYF